MCPDVEIKLTSQHGGGAMCSRAVKHLQSSETENRVAHHTCSASTPAPGPQSIHWGPQCIHRGPQCIHWGPQCIHWGPNVSIEGSNGYIEVPNVGMEFPNVYLCMDIYIYTPKMGVYTEVYIEVLKHTPNMGVYTHYGVYPHHGVCPL